MAAKVRKLGTLPFFDPKEGYDPSFVLSWTGDELDYIEKTIGEITYRKTFTWSGGNLVTMSEWVKL